MSTGGVLYSSNHPLVVVMDRLGHISSLYGYHGSQQLTYLQGREFGATARRHYPINPDSHQCAWAKNRRSPYITLLTTLRVPNSPLIISIYLYKAPRYLFSAHPA